MRLYIKYILAEKGLRYVIRGHAKIISTLPWVTRKYTLIWNACKNLDYWLWIEIHLWLCRDSLIPCNHFITILLKVHRYFSKQKRDNSLSYLHCNFYKGRASEEPKLSTKKKYSWHLYHMPVVEINIQDPVRGRLEPTQNFELDNSRLQ